MVTAINYACRESDEGKKLYALVLQGAPEFIRSINTNKLYMTARRASILTTFNESECKKLIGVMFPGTIIKVECEQYEYTIPETGNKVNLNFRYEYSEQPANIEEVVFEVPFN